LYNYLIKIIYLSFIYFCYLFMFPSSSSPFFLFLCIYYYFLSLLPLTYFLSLSTRFSSYIYFSLTFSLFLSFYRISSPLDIFPIFFFRLFSLVLDLTTATSQYTIIVQLCRTFLSFKFLKPSGFFTYHQV
jgi:hypothetical protein